MITTIQPQAAKISTVDALWTIIQSQSKSVRKALVKRLLAEDKTMAQQHLVKESLSRAFEQLHSGEVCYDAENLFADES